MAMYLPQTLIETASCLSVSYMMYFGRSIAFTLDVNTCQIKCEKNAFKHACKYTVYIGIVNDHTLPVFVATITESAPLYNTVVAYEKPPSDSKMFFGV